MMIPYQTLRQRITSAFESSTFLFPPKQLYVPINYALEQSGKRIRPILVLMATDLFGGDVEKALFPAMGLEIFHNFTLLHDDIMDQAPLRRGRPTVHSQWNINTAILSGDTMFVIAYEYVAKTDPVLLPRVLDLFNDTARKVCEGQQYDMNFETMQAVTIEDYMLMIRLKTAVLIACSLKLGAIIAGASATDAEIIYEAGIELGLAFQLQDDYLDAFGDVTVFGKTIGGDIITNKKTFLYLKAVEIARGSDLELFRRLLNDPGVTQTEKVEQVINLYRKLKIDDLTSTEVEYHHNRALGILKTLSVDPFRTSELILIMNKMLARDR